MSSWDRATSEDPQGTPCEQPLAHVRDTEGPPKCPICHRGSCGQAERWGCTPPARTRTHVNIHKRDKKHKLYYNKNSPIVRAGHRVWGKSTRSSPNPMPCPRRPSPPGHPVGVGLRVPERGSPQALPPAQRLLSSRRELFHHRKIWTEITPRASAPEGAWPRLILFKNTWVINRHKKQFQ